MVLLRALIALVPASMLLIGSAVLFIRRSSLPAVLQLLGASGIVIVVLTHICEALHWFPGMRWGAEHSVGHYLDLGSAVCGLTLFPIGYLLYTLTKRGR
jgi:hypothetical protein